MLIYSNTSYVLIHLALKGIYQIKILHSNTSYVLIHQAYVFLRPYPNRIQIHPMFLFIRLQRYQTLALSWFKYILCSYSSCKSACNFFGLAAFKYILCSYSSVFHAESISNFVSFKYILCSYSSQIFAYLHPYSNIQIHPMFLFILRIHWISYSSRYSNTSYVLIHPASLNCSLFLYKYSNTSYVLIHQFDSIHKEIAI